MSGNIEKIVTKLSFREPKIGSISEKESLEKDLKRDDLFDKEDIMKFERHEGNVENLSDAEYRTLFDIKDVKGFQEQYYGPNGAGLKNISGQEALTILESKLVGKSTRGQVGVEVNDVHKMATLDRLSTNSVDSRKSMASQLISPDSFTQDPTRKSTLSSLNRKFSESRGLYVPDHAPMQDTVSPSHGIHAHHAGLSRKSSMNRSRTKLIRRLDQAQRAENDFIEQCPNPNHLKQTDSKSNLIAASASFLGREMKKASSWILPNPENDRVTLSTKRNSVPPPPTRTMGFTSTPTLLGGPHTLKQSGACNAQTGDNEASKKEKVWNGGQQFRDEDVDDNTGRSMSFHLLTSTRKASSFIGSLGSGFRENVKNSPTSKSNIEKKAKQVNLPPIASSPTHDNEHNSNTSPSTRTKSTDTLGSRSLEKRSSSKSLLRITGQNSLSSRHYKALAESSAGRSKPVIYTIGSDQNNLTEAMSGDTSNLRDDDTSVYSQVTSYSNMLEVGKEFDRISHFKPSSMQHLDLSRVAESRGHQPEDMKSVARLSLAADVGPELPEKDLGEGWRACWDNEAGSVYYYNEKCGEATWLPPVELLSSMGEELIEGDGSEEGDFFRVLNNGLPRGLSELHMGDSELTIKTRTIAARHNLFSKLRNRYEGDRETEYTASLVAREHLQFGQKEHDEIMNELNKEIDNWVEDEQDPDVFQ